MTTFRLTDKQSAAMKVLSGNATHTMLFGGSRSGKTFLLVRAVIVRALKAAKSRHAILRFRFNHCKQSIVLDTFPKVMSLCFPGVRYELNRTDWYATLVDNGAEVWFGGLDDKERTEKILGMEFATIYLNECSQISKGSRDTVVTRLAQSCDIDLAGVTGGKLKPRMFYECNPPAKTHWTYRIFVEKRDPETKRPISEPNDYAFFQINPRDNVENLPAEYLKTLEGLPAHLQRRFLHGEFTDATSGTLFSSDHIDKWRVTDGRVPQFQRIVIGVDPSGSEDEGENANNDAVGIVVVALGLDGVAYVLQDATVNAGPTVWGRVVASAFDRFDADMVVGEENFGGGMVRFVIQTARNNTPYRSVKASRGKVVRAEPLSPLYDQGKVRHVGYFMELEDEMQAFTTNGYMGTDSPNRADALFWALTELFSGIVQPRKNVIPAHQFPGFQQLTPGMGY